MSLLEDFENNTEKTSHIPNAFMMFVHEQRLLKNFPTQQGKNDIATFLGKKWRSMTPEEKKVYHDQYNSLIKTKEDKPDLNSDTEEQVTEDEDMEISTDDEEMAADHEANKIAHKPIVDDSADLTHKKHRPNSPMLSDIDHTPSILVVKQKPLKKSRRPPNAFMLFANEKRGSLDTSNTKDKKCHTNSILGNMWRELPDSEKFKYLTKARRLMNLHKKSESASSSKISKKKKKVRFELPQKPLRRSSQQKKEVLPKISTKLRNFEKSEVEAKSSRPVVAKMESMGSTQPWSEPRAWNDYPSSSAQLQHTLSKYPPHRMPPSTEEPYHSSHCSCPPTLPPHCDRNDIFRQYTDTGMSRSYYGAGFLPPMFPSYPVSPPFSMYQQAMSPPMFPPSMGFPPPPSLCGWSSPYPSNSTYFNAYSSLYAGSVVGPFLYGSSHTRTSATVTKDESAEVTKTTGNSEEEVLVVDGGSDGQGYEAVN